MFAVDYPCQNMDQAAGWIETCDIGEDDRSKIAYGKRGRDCWSLTVTRPPGAWISGSSRR